MASSRRQQDARNRARVLAERIAAENRMAPYRPRPGSLQYRGSGYGSMVAGLVRSNSNQVAMRTAESFRTSRISAAALRAEWATTAPAREPWKHQREALVFFAQREADAEGLMLCDDMGLGKSLMVLLHIYEEIDARMRAGQSRFGAVSLIVCTKTLLLNWERELGKSFTGRGLRFRVFRENKGPGFSFETVNQNFDVILMTYDTILSAYAAREAATPHSYTFLYQGTWRRVVADEAHKFCNPNTQLYAAMCALGARSRWFMTGTPYQNHLENLHAALRYIGVPLPPDLVLTTAALQGYRARYILRRTEADAPDIVPYVPRPPGRPEGITFINHGKHRLYDEYVHYLPFARSAERALYDGLMTQCRGAGNRTFEYLYSMRMACVHPRCIPGLTEAQRAPLPAVPTKMRRLLHDVNTKWSDPAIKILVFDDSVLALKEARRAMTLHLPSVQTQALYGEMSAGERRVAIDAFRTQPAMRMFFMSTTIANIGLNLPEACVIVFLSMRWNPHPFLQAIARVLRFGQIRRPQVHWYAIAGSIEVYEARKCTEKRLESHAVLEGDDDDDDDDNDDSKVEAKLFNDYLQDLWSGTTRKRRRVPATTKQEEGGRPRKRRRQQQRL